jgi:hypothetical protein
MPFVSMVIMKIYEGHILSTITAPVFALWENKLRKDIDLDSSHACYSRINSVSQPSFLQCTTFVLTITVVTIFYTEQERWTDAQVL